MEQEQNHRYGDHLEVYQLGGGRRKIGENVQGLKRTKIKTMNIKMAINSQQSTTEPKKQTKQTTRTGTESQKWRSHGGLSGEGEGDVHGTRSIIGRHTIDRG